MRRLAHTLSRKRRVTPVSTPKRCGVERITDRDPRGLGLEHRELENNLCEL